MRPNKNLTSRLRHKVRLVLPRDGGELEHICSTFAEIAPISDSDLREFDNISFGHLLVEEYFIITIRYLECVKATMRIAFRNKIFAIKRIVNPYSLNHVLKIIALEITESA